MKLTPYQKLLAMGKEAVDATLAMARAHSAKKKAELKLAELAEQKATLEKELQEECSKKDVNFDAIISKMDAIDTVSRRERQFTQILTEMFPTK